MSDFREALAVHRPDLLRHCYRMLGCFAEAEDAVQDVILRAWSGRATYSGEVPISHWLLSSATHACLNVLAQRRRRKLPQREHPPAAIGEPLHESDASEWLSPAPDAKLFSDPAAATETREQVALAFIALLQCLPPRQRAVLLLKDVLGWPANEIAQVLETSLSAVNSSLHRARRTVATEASALAEEPPPAVLREYVRSWEEHDVETLVSLLRRDVVFAMPPHSVWFQGARSVEGFLRSEGFTAFWATGLRVLLTRANGTPALSFFLRAPQGVYRRRTIQVVRFRGGRVAEVTTFIGAHYFEGFDLPEQLEPTVA